jgi:hypothetical protein
LWDLSEQIFDKEGQVNSTLCTVTSTHPECEPPTREDLADSTILLCQLIKQASTVAEAFSARLNNS